MQGYPPSVVARYEERTASFFFATLLTRLRPGMRVLDCGCGPGSITLDLAEAVAPGEVIGIDLEASQVARAEVNASDRGIANARFQVGDAHKLPFPDASFDAVCAHSVLQYLKDPWKALAEMHRVLKPGGVIAIGTGDAWEFWPPYGALYAAYEIIKLVVDRSGTPLGFTSGNARGGKHTLQKAGFVRCEMTARCEVSDGSEPIRRFAEYEALRLEESPVYQQAIDMGLVDRRTLEFWAAEIRAWGERPDAFRYVVVCEAIGYKEG